MRYVLKHKNVDVLVARIQPENAYIKTVEQVLEPNHIPVSVKYSNGIIETRTLQRWLYSRSIPMTRQGINDVLDTLGECSTNSLILQNYALSLSDCYWLCPHDADLTFEDVNFFENDFSEDMGALLFNEQTKMADLCSPDNTSDGWLKKKWIIQDGIRYLVKGGSGLYIQEPYNEAIATTIFQELAIAHVPYTVERQQHVSLCPNFLSPDTELIPASNLLLQHKKPNHISTYNHLIHVYTALGIAKARQQLDTMLIADYLIGNTDRHFGNFGLIRDSNTLEYTNVAPLYDNGTSLFMNALYAQGFAIADSKPFKTNHHDQIRLVKDRRMLPVGNVLKVLDNVYNLLPDHMESERKEFIVNNLRHTISSLNDTST